MTETGAEGSRCRFLVVFSGSGYAAEAMANVVSELEGRGHQVELVSYLGLAAQTARTIAEAAGRGLRAAMRTVTGGLSGDDPLGLTGRDDARYDAVVVASPELMSATRAVVGDTTLCVGLMADLGWDSRWTDSENDVLVMPHEAFRGLALHRGWGERAVRTAGVPLPRSFSRDLDVEGLRKRFGLDPGKGRLVLIVAEGVDAARLERLAFQLSLLDQPLQPIFYTGEDVAASETLRKATKKYGVVARMFGKVNNLEEFYAICELVLAEVSNPLIYPLLALDKPVVLFDADVDTRPVGAFLRDEGAASLVPDLLRLGAELDAVLGDPEVFGKLSDAARLVVDTKGAQAVAEALEALAKDKDTLIGGGRRRVGEEETSAQDEALSGGGAFEVIGGEQSAPPSAPSGPTGGTPSASPPPRIYEPPVSAISAAEAKDQLAALILEERRVEKKLSETTRFVSQWESRLDLAEQADEPDLAREAERFIEHYRGEEQRLLREIESIRSQKDKLKRRVVRPGASGKQGPASGGGSGQGSAMENRFRDMEINRDLSRLKSRLDRDD